MPRLLVNDNGEKIIIAFEVLRLVARLRTGGDCCPCPASVSASVAVKSPSGPGVGDIPWDILGNILQDILL